MSKGMYFVIWNYTCPPPPPRHVTIDNYMQQIAMPMNILFVYYRAAINWVIMSI
jgi:hypothetical protein